jgi:hypothetical protein
MAPAAVRPMLILQVCDMGRSCKRLAEAIAKPNQAIPRQREKATWPRITPGCVFLWSGQGLKRCRKRGLFRTVLRRMPQWRDSGAEQRGFELPVLFPAPGTYEGLEVSAGSLR